jgi:hypothetical protein
MSTAMVGCWAQLKETELLPKRRCAFAEDPDALFWRESDSAHPYDGSTELKVRQQGILFVQALNCANTPLLYCERWLPEGRQG